MIFLFGGIYTGARVANLENVFWNEYKKQIDTLIFFYQNTGKNNSGR
jgi:hypothetical protein